MDFNEMQTRKLKELLKSGIKDISVTDGSVFILTNEEKKIEFRASFDREMDIEVYDDPNTITRFGLYEYQI